MEACGVHSMTVNYTMIEYVRGEPELKGLIVIHPSVTTN
ncbi:hypothetical protein KGM_216012 [Danaus plexippus plexippus]|uniref:Uncharacterized protein n=1 Tax=Danaus plexippus plexippus TaxID=278856 RepID=A0A212ESH2_DANPL|nr:hypothetical protein KGM_216012 [Danaus plexippus plexippus]